MIKAFAIVLVVMLGGNQTPIEVYSKNEETCLNELETFMNQGVFTPWGRLMPLDGLCTPREWKLPKTGDPV